MSTPTPRTSAAIIASGFQAVPEGFRAFAGILERELTALATERDQLRAELADQAARFHDEIVRRQGTVRANQELDLKERDHLLDLLRDDWARLEKMRTLLTASNAKLALIFGELTAGESRTVRAVLNHVLSIH